MISFCGFGINTLHSDGETKIFWLSYLGKIKLEIENIWWVKQQSLVQQTALDKHTMAETTIAWGASAEASFQLASERKKLQPAQCPHLSKFLSGLIFGKQNPTKQSWKSRLCRVLAARFWKTIAQT